MQITEYPPSLRLRRVNFAAASVSPSRAKLKREWHGSGDDPAPDALRRYGAGLLSQPRKVTTIGAPEVELAVLVHFGAGWKA